jgi:hypothetical protein
MTTSETNGIALPVIVERERQTVVPTLSDIVPYR